MSHPQHKEIAELILRGFDVYRAQFKEITAAAKQRFERADWVAAQQASIDRIELYEGFHRNTLAALDERFTLDAVRDQDWSAIKRVYLELISRRRDFDLAETIYNTLYRKLFDHREVNDSEIFIRSPFREAPVRSPFPLFKSYLDGDLARMCRTILLDCGFGRDYENIDRDVANMVRAIERSLVGREPHGLVRMHILKSVFYRNKGAYLIGRMISGSTNLPVAIALLNDEGGIYVDGVVLNENDLSIIFSFTRSYFMVEVEYPFEMVSFLRALLPVKKLAELYNSIGFFKHGKTEFYRDLLQHLDHSSDQFVIAPGIKGLVMTVFMLPSFEVVFKIIRDRFAPSKEITRAQVRASYYFVKTHDRVGRMADTQEFSNFVLPRARMSEELIEELLNAAPSCVEVRDDEVLIRHLYIERMMTPLNLYIEQEDEDAVRHAIDDYGNAIKQLAAANIFPGDLLLKNFGVTRHGRVVFYDYDEICDLTEVNFRAIPEPMYPEQELSAEPWYSVGPKDVFPEEFRSFLFHKPEMRALFAELHGEIYDPTFWQSLQRRVQLNQWMDVFPYQHRDRFERIQ